MSKNNQETVLTVEGMSCPSCVHHIESALRELDGIDAVEVKLKDGIVRVEHDPSRSTVGQMVEALGEAGYGAHAPR